MPDSTGYHSVHRARVRLAATMFVHTVLGSKDEEINKERIFLAS